MNCVHDVAHIMYINYLLFCVDRDERFIKQILTIGNWVAEKGERRRWGACSIL
jgi:hypothetical protein